PLKIEEDGRMFPVSDSSQTIIDCFVKEVTRLGISLIKKTSVQNIIKENGWLLETNKGVFTSEKIVIASGSNPKIWNLLKKLGHTIIEPVPSLFTFNINDIRINDLPGIAKKATVSVLNQKNKKFIESQGDLLITHKGLSGPAILKLSAWNAIELNEINYTFKIKINWLLDLSYNDVVLQLRQMSTLNAKQTVYKYAQFELPKRLWQNLLLASSIQKDLKWAEISKLQIQELANQLTAGEYEVMGKSTFKEEFVTAGGVDLKEINFKKFNSKIHPDLYFAGEVLNIDAITGGFNFQNAWTGGFIVAKSI
ncbi:MAG: putative Rossmann fold flavoprotein, partial [Flavobacteriaceae bacterium]